MTSNENIIPSKELDTAKFWVKRELEGKYLPFLPEPVEERLFIEGRTAWNYNYSDLNVRKRKTSKKITFNISALLKNEFHHFVQQHYFRFDTTCIYYPATHTLKVAEIARIEQ